MKIKITPFNPIEEQWEKSLKIGHFFYYAKYWYGGMVTEINDDDHWCEEEMSLVSKSELPFITAIRHGLQKDDTPQLVSGLTPILNKHSPFYEIVNITKFPNKEECKQLIMKYCDYATKNNYTFYSKQLSKKTVFEYQNNFDITNDFFTRAGSCLYKAYILLHTNSSTFAEEIYINIFIAFEAIIEYLQQRDHMQRKEVIQSLSPVLKNLVHITNFEEYEEEMRDNIRNNIIHPFRDKSLQTNAHPFLMADYVFEDLEFVDYFFKKVLKKEF